MKLYLQSKKFFPAQQLFRRSRYCFRKARRADRLSRSLECAIPDAVLDALEEEIRLSEDAPASAT